MRPRDLSTLLRICRKDTGMSQKQLGTQVGLTSETIRRWEKGMALEQISNYFSALEACGKEVLVRNAKS